MAVDANLYPLMHEAVCVHAGADAGLVEEVHRDLLDHAGADTAEHISAGLPLQNNVVDATAVEELTKQQAGRTRTDDDDLRAHDLTVASHGSGASRRQFREHRSNRK